MRKELEKLLNALDSTLVEQGKSCDPELHEAFRRGCKAMDEIHRGANIAVLVNYLGIMRNMLKKSYPIFSDTAQNLITALIDQRYVVEGGTQ